MDKLTVAVIQEGIEKYDDFHKFHQFLAHKLDRVTRTDEAVHKRNLARLSQIKDDKYPKAHFDPNYHKPSFIEDEFAEFRPPVEEDEED